jgi:hypothetical protein
LTAPSQFFLKAYFSFIFGGAIALRFFIFASAAEFQIFIFDCVVFVFGFRLFSSFEYSLEGSTSCLQLALIIAFLMHLASIERSDFD